MTPEERDLMWRAYNALEHYHREAVRRSRADGYVPSCDEDGCDDQRLLYAIRDALSESTVSQGVDDGN